MTIRHKTSAHRAAAVALAVIGAVPTSDDVAGQQDVREGFHFAIGAGSASVGATCPACTNDFFEDRANGFSGVLRLGGAITPRLVLGAEGMGWISNTETLDRRVAAMSVVLLGYPSATSGFHVKSGVGALRAVAENSLGWIQSDAIVSQIGLGMDFSVGEGVAVTAYVNYLRTFATSTWLDGVVRVDPLSPNVIQLGTALTVN